MSELDLATLKRAVADAAAFRTITTLDPAGGPGDKIFPPTYVKEGRSETRYAFEKRRMPGQAEPVNTVLLDSVASQANRMEEALLEGSRSNELLFPLIEIDFSKEKDLEDLDKLTTLQAPHRIADALFRDSVLDKTLFRQTEAGRAFTDARPNAATAMYKYCPTALLFGIWDSTGPKGGMGAKFQRCLVSEIIGVNAVAGSKTASRLDPVGIEKGTTIYQHKDPVQEWTAKEEDAAREGGKAKLFARKGEGKGTPAAINHGNVAPTIDGEAGGVTIDYAQQTTVLSLAGLRRLRFPTRCEGGPIAQEDRPAAEAAARVVLAALGLCAIAYQRAVGYDLRSRSLLVPRGPLQLELLSAEGGEPQRFTLTKTGAAALLKAAADEARKLGLGWDTTPLTLKPAPKLAELIRQSRLRRQAGEAEDTAEVGR